MFQCFCYGENKNSLPSTIMIPLIALMIAVYGTGRFLNDALKKHTGSWATVFTWLIGLGAIAVLWFLALMVNAAGVQQ